MIVPSAPFAPEKALFNKDQRHTENVNMIKMRQFDLDQGDRPSTPVKHSKVSEFTLYETIQ